MSDRDDFAALFTRVGIPFEDRKRELSIQRWLGDGESPKIAGYHGFAADFEFDDDGRFVRVSIYE